MPSMIKAKRNRRCCEPWQVAIRNHAINATIRAASNRQRSMPCCLPMPFISSRLHCLLELSVPHCQPLPLLLNRPTKAPHNVPSSPSRSRTSSPGLNAGSPTYGQPSQRKASPSAQLPQLPTLPRTVKSISPSLRSAALSLATPGAPFAAVDCGAEALGPESVLVGRPAARAASARARVAASSAARRVARPQVQSLQARRRLPGLGLHSGAARSVS